MKVILGGVRGSTVVTNTAFSGFGGDTTSFLVQGVNGESILVDFGTGVRNYGTALGSAAPDHRMALLTHYHLDHMNGFPVFSGVYDPAMSLHILGPASGTMSAQSVFSDMMARPFWPLQIEMLQAQLEFETLPELCAQERVFGGLAIRWQRVHHPGGCMAYRLDEQSTGDSLVIATDIEWPASSEVERTGFLRLCTRPSVARLLFFDTHFTRENYEAHQGWGHSTWENAVEVARQAGIKRLVGVHHDPGADDALLTSREVEMRKVFPGGEFGRQFRTYEAGEAFGS